MKFLCHITAIVLFFGFSLTLKAQEADTTRVRPELADTSGTSLGEATVTATRLVFITKKDTVVYDMDALGATKGDMLGDMINRMPGLELRNGQLYFKGRAVTRLLVNGYDFQRGDTRKALDNLPAYIIKSVKAYEGITDKHRVTGIDDGEKEQVVDVILRKEYNGTWTGNADLGYGTDDRYRYRFFANTFTDNMRISVYGGYTNTGQYQSANSNGDWSDNGGAGSSSGNTRYFRPGVSAMWHNKTPRDSVGYFQFEFSFDYDFRGHKDAQKSGSETYLDDNTNTYGLSRANTKNDETILRPQATIIWNGWKGFYSQISASYAHQEQTDRTSGLDGTWTTDVEKHYDSPLDSLAAHAAKGFPLGQAVNLIRQESSYARNANMASASYYLTQKLTPKNLRLSARGYFYKTHSWKNANDMKAYNYYQTSTAQMDPLYNRYQQNANDHTYSQTFVDFNIPVPFLNTLRFTYGFEYDKDKSDTKGYRLERVGDIFASYNDYLAVFGTLPPNVDWRTVARDAEIMLNSNTLNRKHWAEAQIQYAKKHVYASLQNTVKFIHEELDYAKGDYTPLHPRRNTTSYILNAQFHYKTDSVGEFRFAYFYERQPAGISNYVDIPDYTDPLNVRLGSAAFGTQQEHNVTFNYNMNFRDHSFLSFQADWEKVNNSTATRSTYDKETGRTTSQMVNVDGAWTYRASANYSRAVGKKKRANYSFGAYYNFFNTPVYSTATSGDPVLRNDKTNSLYVSNQMNVNCSKVSVNVSADISYSRNKSVQENVSGTKLTTAYYNGGITWRAPIDFVFKTNVSVRHYITSTARQFDNVRAVWNASITKSFLRDKALALQLECSDILNQRSQNGVSQTTTNRTWFEARCVGRYFMLHAIYRFSTKKK